MTDTAKTDEEVAAEGLLAIPVAWLLGWLSGAVKALVVVKGWEWFVADAFDVSPLPFVTAWGLMLLVSFVTMHITPSEPSQNPMMSAVSRLGASLALSGLYFLSLLILAGFR